MKKSLLTFLPLLFCLVITFNSCNKDDVENIVENLVGKMTCKVNGNDWEASTPAAVISSGQFIITGKQSKKNIAINFNDTLAGDYPIISGNQNVAVYIANTDSSSTSYFLAYQGSLKITTVNLEKHKISGTFSFKGLNSTNADTVNVTNGQFSDINYL